MAPAGGGMRLPHGAQPRHGGVLDRWPPAVTTGRNPVTCARVA